MAAGSQTTERLLKASEIYLTLCGYISSCRVLFLATGARAIPIPLRTRSTSSQVSDVGAETITNPTSVGLGHDKRVF